MTEFKAGDRVVGYGHSSGAKYVGTADFASDITPGGWVLKDVDRLLSTGSGDEPCVVNISLFKPGPDLSFIGPKPEPVEEPTVVLPFEVSGEFKDWITDANGDRILRVDGDATDEVQDKSLTELVKDLLNKHFGVDQ